MQKDTHIFQGMRRDNHPINQDKQFLWDARNIRLTAREDNSLLSITNEKGTVKLKEFEDGETYIGHCIIGNYLVLFTSVYIGHNKKSTDRIYRIEFDKNSYIILYEGELGFNQYNPIQAIYDYESSDIQKVYWTDGINPPRVINIRKPELCKWETTDNNYTEFYSKEAPFNFVQDLKLNEDITVERLPNGNGIFPPGVIQYAFTYYHKYGQESNIFNITEPLYISFNDRGGSPEDNISTSFKVTIGNVQNNFSHLRIYSILRTSIDAVPTVKRVTDIELYENKDTKDSNTKTITYIDDGTTGDVVDPTMLLYIGGKDITAGCITSKDNTLFLGDISYNRKDISTLEINSDIKKSTIRCNERIVKFKDSDNSSSSIYRYQNQLSKNTSTFKVGEVYRLGLQFQYKNGEWSEPVFIKDEVMKDVVPSLINNSLHLPIFETTLSSKIIPTLINNDYIKVRPLVVLPSTKDKNILAQGILCPTVFSYGSRMSNTPFAQSSWLLRPFSVYNPTSSNGNETALKGSIAEFRHLNPLLSGFNRGAEIQNMFLDEEAESFTTDNHNYALNSIDQQDSSYNSIYYVDQSILTFHSPDIEFDDTTQLSIDGNNLKVRLVGAIPFSSNSGDIDVQVSSVVINPDASGFIHRSIINNESGARSLISGLFYEDSFVNDTKNADKFIASEEDSITSWMTYLWHRSGSLNNDCVRPEGKGSQSAVLKKKVISNIKFSNNTKWLKKAYELNTSELQLFNSNEVSLIKIKDPNTINGDITYYGNVDSMNPSYSKFRLVRGNSAKVELKLRNYNFSGYIVVDTDSGQQKIYFTSLKVDNLSGNKVTGNVNGTITSSTIVKVPVQEEDPSTGEINIVYKDLNLNGGTFEITIKDKSYTGTIIKDSNVYIVNGTTNFNIEYTASRRKDTSFNFSAGLVSVDPSNNHIGDYQTALKLPKDAVRIKYKSTPHVVFATDYVNGTRKPLPVIKDTAINTIKFDSKFSKLPWVSGDKSGNIDQQVIEPSLFRDSNFYPSSYLWLAEIIQTVDDEKRFGGTTIEALQNNLWIPAGPAVTIGSTIQWLWGDTWFQRYDCLKTYPFTNEDTNQVVEIGSFMCETRVNIDGRYDRNRGAISNLNMSPINFNKINPVYSQKNTFFNYRMLDADYYNVNQYPSQVMWTGVKSPSAIQDTWTNLHMANSIDLDGTAGKVTSIQSFNDLLIGFQERGIEQILFNNRVQIQASDGVPIEIANSQKVEGTRTISNVIGCQDKFSTISTIRGIYFVDSINKSIYIFNGSLTDLSIQSSSSYWLRKKYDRKRGWMFPSAYYGTGSMGIRLFYDPKNQDVYFSPGYEENGDAPYDALCYSELLNQFTSFMSYGGAVMFPIKDSLYSIAYNRDFKDKKLAIWKNFIGKYNNIFDSNEDYWISFISNDNPTLTKIFDTIEMEADCYIPNSNREDNFGLLGKDLTHIKQTGKPFNCIRVDNEYQDTGFVELDSNKMRKKFRIWRTIIPRNKGSRDRIRNPWSKITLKMSKPEDKMTILHNLSVNYTI